MNQDEATVLAEKLNEGMQEKLCPHMKGDCSDNCVNFRKGFAMFNTPSFITIEDYNAEITWYPVGPICRLWKR